MTLLIVTAEFPYAQGEGFLEDEIGAVAAGFERVVVAPSRWWGRTKREVLPEEIRVIRLPWACRGAWGMVLEILRHPLRLTGVLLLIMRDLRHLPKNVLAIPFGVAVARFAREADVQHIHAHWLATSSTAAMIASVWSGVPFSITAHRWDIFDGNLAKPKIARAAFLRFISESGRTAWRNRHSGHDGKLILLRMGVKLPERTAPIRPGAVFRVACPANLIPVKAHCDLLEAVARVRRRGVHLELSIIGEGPLRADLTALAEALGIADICRFTGQLPHAELLDMYAQGRFDCVVLPSRDLGGGLHEGIPVSLMEAMSYGVPVIATRTGGIPELIRDRIDGLLADGGQPEQLAACLEELAIDQQLLGALAAAARARIAEAFDVSRVGERLHRLICHAEDRLISSE